MPTTCPTSVLLRGSRVRIVGKHTWAGHAGRVVRVEIEDHAARRLAYRVQLDGRDNGESIVDYGNLVPLLGKGC